MAGMAFSCVTRVLLIHPLCRRRFRNNGSVDTVYIAVPRKYVLSMRSDEIMLARHSIYERNDVASTAEMAESAAPCVDLV